MVKILRLYLFIAGLLMVSVFNVNAQNCTVNAGVNTTICPGSQFKLLGTFNGLISSNPTWTQVSGPSVTISTTLIAGSNATATVTGYAADVNYVFRISAKCTDGSLVYQDVTYVVSSLGNATAGPDAYGCPGTPFVLQGSALGVGETGKWTRISGSGPPIINDTQPNATLNFTTNASAVNGTYRWTVSKTTGGSTCTSFDDVVITNLGTATVNAGTDQNLSCYNVTTSTTLNGSNAGTNATYGQSALWTFVSGPSIPTISNTAIRNPNVSNLIQGTYVFRYTVTGPCQNGSDEVSINVAPASQNITNAGGGSTQTYCDGRTSVLLTAPKALYAGETMLWTGGGGGVTITNPTNNVTTATGLSGLNGSSNTFTYTITNSITGCSSTGNYTIQFKAPPTISITGSNPIFVTCNDTKATINYTVNNGTGTEYALISAPSGSSIQTLMGGLNNFVGAPGSGTELTGFDKIGTYVLRYRRNTDNGSGGCSDAYADVTIVASASPTAANAGTKQVLACNVFTTALAGNIPLVGVGKWSQISGPNTAIIVNPFLNNTTINGLVSGKYTFRWIISGGDGACSNTQGDVDVVVSSQTPTASVVGSDAAVCNSTPIYLTGNTPALNETGAWTVTKNGGLPAPEVVFSSTTNPSAVATGLANNTTYTFTWTITNNCSLDYPGLVAPASYTITTSNINGPKQADAGVDICRPSGTTSFTLAGNAPTGTEVGTWTKISGPNITITNPALFNTTVTGATNGTYVFQWKLENNGCSPTTDLVTITISAAATVANAGANQNICGTTVTLAGNTPTVGVGVWTQTEGAGGAIITNPALPGTTVTGLTEGRYKFVWTITNGACASSAPSEVTINVSLASSVAIAGPAQAVCNATSTTLAATPVTNGVGNWSAVSGPSIPVFADANNPTTLVSNLKYGVYVLRWTSRGGVFCPVTQDDVTITVTQNANAGTDRAICSVNSVTLTGNENSTGTWTNVSGPNVPTLTATGTNSSIATGLIAGVYKFKYSLPAVGACVATEDEIQITIEAAPSPALAGADQEQCQPTATATSSFTMAATPPAVGTGKWVLLDKTFGTTTPTITNINSATTTITGMQPGVYLYEWSVSNIGGACVGGNSNADIVRLTVFKEPSAALAGSDQLSACSNNVTMAAVAPVVGIGTWSVVSQPGGSPAVVFSAINSPTTKITNLQNGPYVFRWTVENGSPTCASKSDDVNVTVTTTPVTVANAGLDQSVCNTLFPLTTTFVLAGSAPGAGETGTWTIISQPTGSAATFSDANSNTATISGLMAPAGAAVGTYVLRWTIKNSLNMTPTDCDSFDEVTIKVYNLPSVSNAGTNQNVCLSSSVTLNATPVAVDRGVGTWSSDVLNPTVPVFSNINSPTSTLSGLVAGTYKLTWTVSNGNCIVSTSDVTVVVSNCEIAIAKSTSTPVQQANGSYNITLTFKVKNTGNAALSGVQVEDNLLLTFPSPKTWTVTSLNATGTLVANSIGVGGFNGNTNQQLLSNTSALPVSAEETITLVLNVQFN